MSIFRPHKTKPRQFNYIPRYYDPVKEERNLRRKQLHGTSTQSDGEEYVPGKYVRTQREAREVAREDRSSEGMTKIRSLVVVTIVIALGVMWLLPHIMDFVIAASEEKQAANGTAQQTSGEELSTPLDFVINESIDIENMEGIESLDDEMIDELEKSEWRNKRIIIVPNE